MTSYAGARTQTHSIAELLEGGELLKKKGRILQRRLLRGRIWTRSTNWAESSPPPRKITKMRCTINEWPHTSGRTIQNTTQFSPTSTLHPVFFGRSKWSGSRFQLIRKALQMSWGRWLGVQTFWEWNPFLTPALHRQVHYKHSNTFLLDVSGLETGFKLIRIIAV